MIGLVLLAAVFHASWNAIMKAAENPLALATRAVTLGVIVSVPIVGGVWIWQGRPGLPPFGWLLVLISGALELAYFIALSTAYERGELSTVYPIARGTAPLLAVVIGLLLLGERLGAAALVGVLCLLIGIWAVRRPTPAGAALVPALITGVLIASYSAVDRVGVRLGPPWLYGELLWLVEAVFLIAFTRVTNVPGSTPNVQPRTSLVVGLLMTTAYFIVLYALSLAPLSVVAPLRESAIVLVTAWGVWRLGEQRGAWLRLSGALAIVAGIAVLAIGER